MSNNFQERFEEEIERIGISAAAKHLGVVRNTIYNWIAKGNAPLNFLITLQEVGLDINYVLTGIRSSLISETKNDLALTKRETALLDNYRNIEMEEDKRAIDQVALRAAEVAKLKTEFKEEWSGLDRRKKA